MSEPRHEPVDPDRKPPVWLVAAIACMKALRFPFRYGKIEFDIEEGRAQRYRVTENGRI